MKLKDCKDYMSYAFVKNNNIGKILIGKLALAFPAPGHEWLKSYWEQDEKINKSYDFRDDSEITILAEIKTTNIADELKEIKTLLPEYFM